MSMNELAVRKSVGTSLKPAADARVRLLMLVLCSLLLIGLLGIGSMLMGAGDTTIHDAWGYLQGDPTLRSDENLDMVLRTLRWPRTIGAVVVGAAGPIAFVALAAPILSSRLVGPSHVPLLTSAWTGCVLVLAADTLGRRIAYPQELPVEVVCSVLGGPFLLWVVLRQPASR
jgi:ABC-type Fe3+-siderophore transport system permease subunit